MPNSNRGFGRGNGTITVIEEPVMRSYRRKAKIVFYVTWVITAVLAATVAASRWHPIIALLAGLACGYILGAAAGVDRGRLAGPPRHLVVDPRNHPEPAAWSSAGSSSPTTPPCPSGSRSPPPSSASPPPSSRSAPGSTRPCWCLVTRHRIRTCFSEFIITNRTGSLPLILWARPTPVGERVWIWLRPGLSLDDLHDRLDKIAVTCWATAALAEAASRSNAAFVRLDIKRRDVLTGTITSPLLDMIKSGTPATERDTAEIPTALDLPQVAASEVIPIRPTPLKRPDHPRTPAPASPPAPAASDGSDITDWI